MRLTLLEPGVGACAGCAPQAEGSIQQPRLQQRSSAGRSGGQPPPPVAGPAAHRPRTRSTRVLHHAAQGAEAGSQGSSSTGHTKSSMPPRWNQSSWGRRAQ
ncbi:unnamed protein product [Prorocentrum cordatum]|uniref:Uncharacterized protein n=1 Tax=Prorocentrum cordatum TaxID=2364126 RepID=A0ABN9TPJ5_9DINO|nr:unnamed protein product [Polarella glacialis]